MSPHIMDNDYDDNEPQPGTVPMTPVSPPYWPLWPLQPAQAPTSPRDELPRQVVPGHSILGKGFNIFGRYNSSAARKMLFDTTETGDRTWLNAFSGNTYLIPEQVDDPLPVGAHEGSSHVFSSRSDVSEYFAAEAGLSARFRVFSGEFKAAFSGIASSVQDYHMGLYSVKSRSYKLRLKDDSFDKLYPGLEKDPDFTDLPESFDPTNHANTAKFFAFFAKFGTHYVNEVVMGARLDYFVYADKAQVSSQKSFEANLRAEVKAVFFAGKAESQLMWTEALKSWVDARTVRISTIGSVSILNSLVPEKDQNFHELYSQWLAMAQAAPMPVEYKLKSVADAFSGKKAIALRLAMEAYASKSIVLKAVATPFTDHGRPARIGIFPNPDTALPQGFVNLNEREILAAPSAHDSPKPYDRLAIALTAIHARTLEVVFKHAYEFDNHNDGSFRRDPAKLAYDSAFADVQGLLAKYDKSELIFAVLIPWVMNRTDFPTSDFYNFLMNLGAGDALNEWWRALDVNTSVLNMRVAYGIVGMFRGAICSSAESYVTYYTQERSSGGLLLESFLEPMSDGHSFIYVPS
ncbi:hypothetical protein ASD78_01190 [Lysobacter sp. Root667]|uniref:MAC/perforin domain-containing protein n=1 Tax=Lysobacter sp. Root667 TaxID=1736581 RepID=UPI0007023907|nr:MAC/perforin domain-containing protein [Lysobacter sp. Root667]KRA81917.1 hypothetical protein ASD78_01190 [Lysobacter sp. Root667]